MNEDKRKQLEEQRERMIESTRWDIEYYSQKLKEAKNSLQVLINSKPHQSESI